MAYVYVKAPNEFPGKTYGEGRRVLEHHLVWWLNTGETVPKGFVIHHKDENKKNNSFSNLEKLGRGEHTAAHHTVHGQKEYTCICGLKFMRSAAPWKSKEPFCSRSCSSKVTRNSGIPKETIEEIKRMNAAGISSYRIAASLSISRNTAMKYSKENVLSCQDVLDSTIG